ncbi:MAG TPA: hypothetical protein VF184_03960 [Phycisphaeraceae bacterium]
MSQMKQRWTSRKFLVSLVAQLAAVAVLMWPEHESTIVEASRSIGSLLVITLTALGYVAAEASVDRQRVESQETPS